MVRTRVAYGALMGAGLAGLLAADAWLSDPSRIADSLAASVLGFGGLTALLFAALLAGGSLELCRLLRRAGHRPMTAWCTAACVLFAIEPWVTGSYPLHETTPIGPTLNRLLRQDLPLLLPTVAMAGTAAVAVWRRRTKNGIADSATSLLVILYLGFLGAFAVRLRCWQPDGEGTWLLLSVLVVVKLTDIGAYFTGLAIGRHRMIPSISPKKTWEGLAGGVAASAGASALLLGWVVPAAVRGSVVGGLSWPQVIVFGVVMSITGQCGDLWESVFKRDSGAKDSGSLVPQFGGILDMIDSPLLALPVGYWLLRWWLA